VLAAGSSCKDQFLDQDQNNKTRKKTKTTICQITKESEAIAVYL